MRGTVVTDDVTYTGDYQTYSFGVQLFRESTAERGVFDEQYSPLTYNKLLPWHRIKEIWNDL